MSYPDNCIKGIRNNDFLIDDKNAGPNLFQFQDRDTRDDGWIEESINWEDDSSAVDFTLNHCKDGERQFKAGVAIIPRNEIDSLIRRPAVTGRLSYERKFLENNPYHGNILLRANIPKPTKRMIAAGLALAVSNVIPQSQE